MTEDSTDDAAQHVNADNTALVVVDMQNDFADPEGALYAPPSETAVEGVNTLIDIARENDLPVIATKDTHDPDQFTDAHYYDEFDQWGEHVVTGSWGSELVDDVRIDTGSDTIIEKHTYDAFYDTRLDDVLTGRGIENLIICGTLVNVCVFHTAASAGLRDYRPIVIEDAVGYIEPAHKEYALNHADWLFGEVAATRDVTIT